MGIWEILVDRFGEHVLAQILGVPASEMGEMAHNRIPVQPPVADTLKDLCDLHGITPKLYSYTDWKQHHNVLIASAPDGWMAWSLVSPKGWVTRSRWIGNPAGLSPVEDLYLITLAREHGWPH